MMNETFNIISLFLYLLITPYLTSSQLFPILIIPKPEQKP